MIMREARNYQLREAWTSIDGATGRMLKFSNLSAYPINPRNALFSGKNRVIRIGTKGLTDSRVMPMDENRKQCVPEFSGVTNISGDLVAGDKIVYQQTPAVDIEFELCFSFCCGYCI